MPTYPETPLYRAITSGAFPIIVSLPRHDLDLARDAAHSVARPAAPLTTFLIGYAAAQRGGTPEDVAQAAREAAALAQRWSAEESETSGGDSGPTPQEPPD